MVWQFVLVSTSVGMYRSIMLKRISIYIIVFVIGGAIGYFLMPSKKITKVVYKDKILEIEKAKEIIVYKDGTVKYIEPEKIVKHDTEKTSTKVEYNQTKYDLTPMVGMSLKGDRMAGAMFSTKLFLNLYISTGLLYNLDRQDPTGLIGIKLSF